MNILNNLRYRTLYILWAVLFVLTAVLGLAVTPKTVGVRLAMQLAAAVFFLPPWLILTKAKAESSAHHRNLIRLLAAAALVLAMVMICLNIVAVHWSEGAAAAINIVTTVVTAPMVCGDAYVLSLFLWATLLVGSFGQKK